MKLLTDRDVNKIRIWYVNFPNGSVHPTNKFCSSKWYMMNADQGALFATIKGLLKRSVDEITYS